MKTSVSLPALLAPQTAPLENESSRGVRAPFFIAALVLSPLLWPLGIIAGGGYLCHRQWRAAGALLMTLGVISGAISLLVFAAVR